MTGEDLLTRFLMRILLLNEYFPPDTAATANMAAAVVDALAERHEVTVLCGRPSYDPSERHPFYLLRRDRRGQAVVERVGSTTFPRFRMRQRVWNYLSYVHALPFRAPCDADRLGHGHDRSAFPRHCGRFCGLA